MRIKRLFSAFLALLTLLALPLLSFAEEQKPFLFRDRYTWGMSLEEIMQQAAEEGLVLKQKQYAAAVYEDVPVAGIVAKELDFSCFVGGSLSSIQYTLTEDPQEARVLYPRLLEQLIVIYGEPGHSDLEEYSTWWRLYDTVVALVVRTNGCILSYIVMDPKPIPPVITTEGL